jgi:RNA-directed DNA polymerase
VYCKDANRRGDFEYTSFDFLGYIFRGRLAKGPRGYFTGFSPAISAKAKKAKGKQIRAWHLNRRSGTDLSGLAREINPQVRGWINYYGAFCRSELCFLAWRINEHLARWAMHKFKRVIVNTCGSRSFRRLPAGPPRRPRPRVVRPACR